MEGELSQSSGGEVTTLTENISKSQECINQMKQLLSFFNAIRKEFERFNGNWSKSLEAVSNSFIKCHGWGELIHKFFLTYEKITSGLKKFTNSMKTAIVIPLDTFITTYETNSKTILMKASNLIASLLKSRKQANKCKIQYKKTNTNYNCSKQKQVAENTKEELIKFIAGYNQSIAKHKQDYCRILKQWNDNEDFKLTVIKSTLKTFSDLITELGENLEALQNSSKLMLGLFSDSLKLPFSSVAPHLFESIDLEDKKSSDNSPVERAENYESSTKPMSFERKKIREWFEGNPITQTDKSKLFTFAVTEEGLQAICDEFSKIEGRVVMKNEEAFCAISELSLRVLDLIKEKKEIEGEHLFSILNIGRLVTVSTRNKVCSLRDEISRHSIWKTEDTWNKMVDYKITKAKRASIKSTKNTASDNKVKDKVDDLPAIRPGVYYSELSALLSEMPFYSVKIKVCRKLVIDCAARYNLDHSKILKLVSTYESMRIIPRKKETKATYHQKRCQLKLKYYGRLKFCILQMLSLGFISDNESYLRILLVNKEWNKIFTPRICKMLIKKDCDKYRSKVWRALAYNEAIVYQYEEAKQKCHKNNEKNALYMNERIKVDVERSFHYYSAKDQASITNILKYYAAYNKEVEYCQGMNCIAGFLFIIYNDESAAYNILATLISKYNLSELFKDEMLLLHTCFYKLDHLIAIYLPKLYSYLFKSQFNSAFFASPWFLTIFTYVLQHLKEPKIPQMLIKLFDEFLVDGMVAVFKWALFILEHFETKLVELKYEDFIKFIGEIIKNDFFFNNGVVKEYEEKSKRYDITPELLDYLEEEHNEIIQFSRTCRLSENKEPFYHYICCGHNKYESVCLGN